MKNVNKLSESRKHTQARCNFYRTRANNVRRNLIVKYEIFIYQEVLSSGKRVRCGRWKGFCRGRWWFWGCPSSPAVTRLATSSRAATTWASTAPLFGIGRSSWCCPESTRRRQHTPKAPWPRKQRPEEDPQPVVDTPQTLISSFRCWPPRESSAVIAAPLIPHKRRERCAQKMRSMQPSQAKIKSEMRVLNIYK